MPKTSAVKSGKPAKSAARAPAASSAGVTAGVKPKRKPTPAELEHIIPELRSLAVHVDDLTPDPRNANTGHDLDNLIKSIETYGFRTVITAQKGTGIVTMGNGRLTAVRRRGWKYIPCIYVEEDQHSATGWAITDNRLAKNSQFDEGMLGRLLAELQSADGLEFAIGFQEGELDRLINEATQATETSDVEFEAAEEAPDQTDQLEDTFGVLVTCADEADQKQFLSRMEQEGRVSRVLNTFSGEQS